MKYLLVLFVIAVTANAVFGDAPADKLFRDKVKDYQKDVDPGNFTLYVGMTYLCGTINRRTNILTSRVFERFNWVDPRLVWNPASFAGLRKGSVPADLIWTPDIQLLNAFPHSEERDDVNTVVLANGSVFWIPPATYTTLCEHQENENDPDSWHCRLRLGSWTYNDKEMPVELFAGGFDTKLYMKTCPYVVSRYTAYIKSTKYDCCPEEYLTLDIDFDITERQDDEEEEHKGDDDEPPKKKLNRADYIPKRPCYWPHC